MRGRGFENVATVLVDPAVLDDFELDLMSHDFRVWIVSTVPTFPDAAAAGLPDPPLADRVEPGPWARAADWTLVWITFGESWLDGDEPIPWPAHAALWDKLAEYAAHVRYNVGLGGVPRLSVPRESF